MGGRRRKPISRTAAALSSTRPRPPAPPGARPPDELAAEAVAGGGAEAPPGALARLGRLIPGAEAVVRFAYRTAGLSALGVAAIVVAVGQAVAWAPAWRGSLAVLALVLLVPAGAALLAGWTLGDLTRLPGELREAALGAATLARGERRKRSRLLSVVRALWAARGVALLSKGAWLKAVGALRFLRLASLPFALALAGLFALNGVVILGGVVALVTLLL